MRRFSDESAICESWKREHTDRPGQRILLIPDTQVKPGVPIEHFKWIAQYAAEKRPDVIVHLGDWLDMPSLSSYDRGKRSAENRRYRDDIDAGTESLTLFESTMRAEGVAAKRKVYLLGNHEDRISRACEDEAWLDGQISVDDFPARDHGWEVHEFLRPVEIGGVIMAHYFPVGPNGSVVNGKFGAPSARAQVQRLMRSCVAGHKQGFDYAIHQTPYGTVRGLIAGSAYLHSERYLTPMGQGHWRGIVMLNDVHDGQFGLIDVDLHYLKRRYGQHENRRHSSARKRPGSARKQTQRDRGSPLGSGRATAGRARGTITPARQGDGSRT